MAKTYIPTLRSLVKGLCLYTTRYRAVIEANLDGQALIAFQALTVACDAFLSSLGEPSINP